MSPLGCNTLTSASGDGGAGSASVGSPPNSLPDAILPNHFSIAKKGPKQKAILKAKIRYSAKPTTKHKSSELCIPKRKNSAKSVISEKG